MLMVPLSGAAASSAVTAMSDVMVGPLARFNAAGTPEFLRLAAPAPPFAVPEMEPQRERHGSTRQFLFELKHSVILQFVTHEAPCLPAVPPSLRCAPRLAAAPRCGARTAPSAPLRRPSTSARRPPARPRPGR